VRKALLGAAAIAALFGTSAFAADMAVKAPPPAPPPASNWTGCYIGGNVGGGWTDFSANGAIIPTFAWGSQRDSSAVGGGQVGCDYQLTNWVVGVKGQFELANFAGQNVVPAAPSFLLNSNLRDIGTVTGRLGYTVSPNVLLYAQGGGAWIHDKFSVYGTVPVFFLSETATSDRSGYVVGVGFEYALAPSWSLFAEYNYMGFGTRNVPFVTSPMAFGTPNTLAVRQDVQDAVVGVNWRFNMGGPMAAKHQPA
jgi:outer membrane immunogenic protein